MMVAIGIEIDSDHTDDLRSDLKWLARGGFAEDEANHREELDKIERGEWAAYGVFLLDSNGEPDYSHALWGCVVETPDAEGHYDSPADVPDEYLASVASELERELWTDPLPLCGATQPALPLEIA